jgi:hypothetical protein
MRHEKRSCVREANGHVVETALQMPGSYLKGEPRARNSCPDLEGIHDLSSTDGIVLQYNS